MSGTSARAAGKKVVVEEQRRGRKHRVARKRRQGAKWQVSPRTTGAEREADRTTHVEDVLVVLPQRRPVRDGEERDAELCATDCLGQVRLKTKETARGRDEPVARS